MNRWRLKQGDTADDARQSPAVEWLSFQDLAERLAAGQITEEDLILEEGASEWMAADSIVGLVRAAGRIRRERRTEGPMTPSENIPSENSAEDNITDRQKSGVRESSTRTESNSDQDQATSNIWNQRVPLRQLLSVVIPLAIVAALAWHSWSQASRFPVPSRATQKPAVWSLPVIGNVSTVEFILISLDILLVPIVLVIWFRNGTTKK